MVTVTASWRRIVSYSVATDRATYHSRHGIRLVLSGSPGVPAPRARRRAQVRVGRLHVMLWQRAAELPARGRCRVGRCRTAWARCCAGQLASKVDARQLAHLEQLETRSDPGRDPRGRTVATAYLGLIPSDLDPPLPEDTAWHPVDALPATAFDHGSIVGSALGRLLSKLSYTNVGFAPAPPTFTVTELRTIYVAAPSRCTTHPGRRAGGGVSSHGGRTSPGPEDGPGGSTASRSRCWRSLIVRSSRAHSPPGARRGR